MKTSDYIEVGSLSHHPFYTKFIIEIPDKWMLVSIYNVKLDEMTEIINASLDQGHTLSF